MRRRPKRRGRSGPDWKLRIQLPEVALRTWLTPDWEYPGYWLFKDNRAVSCADLADLLANDPGVTEEQLDRLRQG